MPTLRCGDLGDQGFVGPGHIAGPKRPGHADLRLAVDMIEPLCGHFAAAGHALTVLRRAGLVHDAKLGRWQPLRYVTTTSFSRGGTAATVTA